MANDLRLLLERIRDRRHDPPGSYERATRRDAAAALAILERTVLAASHPSSAEVAMAVHRRLRQLDRASVERALWGVVVTPLRDVVAPRGWREVPDQTATRETFEAAHASVRCFRGPGGLTLILSRTAALGWHLSIAHEHRYPTWDEVRDARYGFVPADAWMAMLLPPPSDYVNVHPNCFQLIEVRREAGLLGDRFSGGAGSMDGDPAPEAPSENPR